MDLITLISYQTECHISKTISISRDLLPTLTTELKHIVIHIERKRDVKVVGAYRWMRPLSFGGLEVQEADLIPQERADVPLKWGQAVGGSVGEAMDSYALGKAHKGTHDNRSGARNLGATKRDL
jgi:hypothetical protein